MPIRTEEVDGQFSIVSHVPTKKLKSKTNTQLGEIPMVSFEIQ